MPASSGVWFNYSLPREQRQRDLSPDAELLVELDDPYAYRRRSEGYLHIYTDTTEEMIQKIEEISREMDNYIISLRQTTSTEEETTDS